MSYRPICDFWFLGRPKVRYYGAYPNGFLERARPLLGQRHQPMLHVCGGAAKQYPTWDKVCPKDLTLDLDMDLAPDFLQDCRDPLPACTWGNDPLWPGILCDPPYTPEDAKHYKPGAEMLPSATALLRHVLPFVRIGGRVGMLHYRAPRPPADGSVKFLACAAIVVGFDNAARLYSVYERLR